MVVQRTHIERSSLYLFLVSSFFQSAFYWFLSIYISKNFGITVLGEYSYALALVTPLTVLASLQLKTYLLTKSRNDLRSQSKWLRLIFPLILFSLSLLALTQIEPWVLPLFIPMVFVKWGELWSDLAYAIWQLESGLAQVNLAILIRYSGLFLLLLLLWVYQAQFSSTLKVLALSSIAFALLDNHRSGLAKIPITVKESAETFKVTLSLSFSALLTSLLINIPRYFLKEFHSVETVGMFSILFYYYVLPSLGINFICQGLLKHFVELKQKVVIKLMLTLLVLSGAYLLVLKLIGMEVTEFLYGRTPNWGHGEAIYIALTFLFGSVASIMHYILMGQNIYHVQLKTNILSVLITTVSGLLLIQSYGISGAFISFLLGLVCQSLIYLFIFMRLKR